MGFPDINKFPLSRPGPYEVQMGRFIVGLLRLFVGRVADTESNTHVLALASKPTHWSAGHAVFDEVRRRLLAATKAKDPPSESQYAFEESCCKAIYNASDPQDPFDSCSPFFVVPQAISLARVMGIPIETIVTLLTT